MTNHQAHEMHNLRAMASQQQATFNNQLGAQGQAAFGMGTLVGLGFAGDYYGRYGSIGGSLNNTWEDQMQNDLDDYLKNWKGE